MVAVRKVINHKYYYAANRDARMRKKAIKSILASRIPWASTLKRFDLGERELNRIRSLDARHRTILEGKYGVELESLYDGKTLVGEMRLPDVRSSKLSPRPSMTIHTGCRRSRQRALISLSHGR